MAKFWEGLDITKFIAMVITLAFVALVFVLLIFKPQLTDAAWAIIAMLGNAFTLLVGYYWGSSAGSKAKDMLIQAGAPPTGPPASDKPAA